MLWICMFLLCPPLSVPRLPHTLSSWMMGSRGLAFSESWANLHEKLSHLHCPRKGYKRQLSPAAGDKVCLSKASAGARVCLRHQDKVWTPAPLTCCLQHRIHRDPQPPVPAPAAGAVEALGQNGGRAQVLQGQVKRRSPPPPKTALTFLLGTWHGDGGGGSGAGLCGAGCRSAGCCRVLPRPKLCLALPLHTRFPLPFTPWVSSWACRAHRRGEEVSAVSQLRCFQRMLCDSPPLSGADQPRDLPLRSQGAHSLQPPGIRDGPGPSLADGSLHALVTRGPLARSVRLVSSDWARFLLPVKSL